MDTNTKMARAKSQLLLNHPFYGVLCCNTPFKQDDSIPTMATNGISIMYYSDFVDSIRDTQVTFVIAHEIGPVSYTHLRAHET